ncbi:MAG: S-formylglutathione hydrolase [Pseudomonadota bacterium]
MTQITRALAHKSFDGMLEIFDHESHACQCTMRFAVYTPPQAASGPVPVLWWLSGLTCTWQNVNEKSGIQRYAAEKGLMVIFPDTSPRGVEVPDNEDYDLGQGAGFYINATQDPWAKNFQMEEYVVNELCSTVRDHFHMADLERQGISGHSMGGHGALTLHLKHPERYKSVSAFAPIVNPSQTPWGEKCFSAYLGDDQESWGDHDACELVKKQRTEAHMLVDVGGADQFENPYLMSSHFVDACKSAGQKLTHHVRDGYDHSYYFVGSFLDHHMAHHAANLGAT